MTRLVTTELTRFFSRSLLWGLAIGAVVLAAFAPFAAWQGSSPASAAEIAEAQLQVDSFEPMTGEDLEACLESDRQYLEEFPEEAEGFESGCSWEPTIEDFLPSRSYFDTDAFETVAGVAVPLALLALVMGASFVAAEFSTGAIGNWLTFAPRRGRVYASKLTAAAVGVVPAAVVALVVLLGGTWSAFAVHDARQAPENHWDDDRRTVADVLELGGRIAALVVGVALAGAALGFLLRHTAAVLGTIVGWAAVVEGYVGMTFDGVRPYLLSLNVQAWVNGGASYWTEKCAPDPDQGNAVVCQSVEQVVSQTHGAVVLGIVGVLCLAAAWFVFRRRDVA